MTDEPITINVPAVQQQAPPPKVYASVEDPLAVYDTARFEHMARIANVMATGRMIPMSIWNDRVGRDWKELPEKVISSRCFMIVNFSNMNRVDPFQAAMSASFVHGRLCWEGKFVDALLQERHEVILEAKWFDDDGPFDPFEILIDPETEEIISNGPLRAKKAGEKLGIMLSGMVDGKRRTLSGVVAQWKTDHAGSPWAKPIDWPKMLKYRGTREWCRLYKPGPITGVLTNDEVADFVDWRQDHDTRPALADRSTELRHRLAHHKVGGDKGFDAAHVARETATEVDPGPGDAEDLSGQEQGDAMEAQTEPVDDDCPGDRPTVASDEPEAGQEPPLVEEPEPPVEPEPTPEPEPEPAPAVEKAARRSADRGGMKEPPPPQTVDAYLGYAELWIGNCEEEGPLMKRWNAEIPLRNGLNAPEGSFDGLRAMVSKRRAAIRLKQAGRG